MLRIFDIFKEASKSTMKDVEFIGSKMTLNSIHPGPVTKLKLYFIYITHPTLHLYIIVHHPTYADIYAIRYSHYLYAMFIISKYS